MTRFYGYFVSSVTYIHFAMKIPRKIDDRIKNAIVQIKFESNLPFGTILGYFHQTFKEQVHFTPSQKPVLSNGRIIGIEESMPTIITFDKNFIISIHEDSFTFDLFDGYKGWEVYQANIQQYIAPIFESSLIKKIHQIGLRYISNFDDVSIYEHINASINLNFVTSNQRGRSMFEFSINNNIVILNLISGEAITNTTTNTPSLGSIIDIDVIQKPVALNTFDELENVINNIHEVEKSVFFSLIKDSFLSTLNPIY